MPEKLAQLAGVEERQVFADPCPLNMGYVFKLISTLPREVSVPLLYPPYEGRWPEDLDRQKSIRAQVEEQDKLLFYPYDSVEPFLLLLSQAAEDPEVLSIKITIYRLASPSKVARILCRAAENGKDVLVLMELRARFDEAHNLAWAKQLEETGCQVIYGMEGFKCHSKVCLITTRSRGRTGYLTQIGTGNYDEKTNAMYTDLCLMTADQAIGEDAAAFFRNMLVNDLEGKYRQLRVSPLRHPGRSCAAGSTARPPWAARATSASRPTPSPTGRSSTGCARPPRRGRRCALSSGASAASCPGCRGTRTTSTSPAWWAAI